MQLVAEKPAPAGRESGGRFRLARAADGVDHAAVRAGGARLQTRLGDRGGGRVLDGGVRAGGEQAGGEGKVAISEIMD